MLISYSLSSPSLLISSNKIFSRKCLSLRVKNLRLELGEESKICLPRASSLSLTHRLSFSWSCFCALSQVPHSLEGTLICWRQSKLPSVHTQHTHTHTCTHAFVFPSLQRTLHQLTLKTYWNANHRCNLPNPP